MSRSFTAKSVDDLDDDDSQAIAQITGALYDGDPIGRRLAHTPKIKRTCSPSTRRDPVLTARFYERCAFHEPRVEAMEKDAKGQLDQIENLLEKGEINGIEDVSEEWIIRGLVRAATDTRRPTVQLKALQALAEMKGMGGPKEGTSAADALEDMLDQLERRSRLRPRAVAPPEGKQQAQ